MIFRIKIIITHQINKFWVVNIDLDLHGQGSRFKETLGGRFSGVISDGTVHVDQKDCKCVGVYV